MPRMLVTTAVAAVLLLLPLKAQGRSPQQFFQLVAQDKTCLQIWNSQGRFSSCGNTVGSFSPHTIFLLNGGTPGYLNIQLFGTAQCLDREHCHSSTSNLRYSECDHCGAIHWSINSDGSVSENSQKNCIYKDSSGNAAVRHCSDGFEKFTRVIIGNRFLLKSLRHGDCLAEDKFENCDSAPTFYTSDLPGNYKIHVFLDSDKCLDREHCHSSTSKVRLYDCTHCGAVHWSIDSSYRVGEDEMKNCVNRGANNAVIMKHCSDGYEKLYFDIIPNKAMHFLNYFDAAQFRDPNARAYLQWNLSQRIRGAKLFKYVWQGQATCELEIVHYLPNGRFQEAHYSGEYMVTHIHTNIPYQNFLTIEYAVGRIATDISRITQYNIRYGMIDTHWQHFGNFDGLYSQFVTNSRGVPVTGYTSNTIHQLERGLQHETYNWHQYYDSIYPGQNNDPQMHIDLFNGQNQAALYWPHTYYSGRMTPDHGANEDDRLYDSTPPRTKINSN